MEKNIKGKKNRVIYWLTIIVIIIIYIVIHLLMEGFKEKYYIDNIPIQPVNHIRGTEKKEPENDNTDNKNIIFKYTEDSRRGNHIYMINQFPMSDEVGKSLVGEFKTFDFKLEFTEKAVGVKYTITAEKLSNSDLPDDWVKAYLSNGTAGINNCFRPNGRIKTYNEYPVYKGKERILYEGTVTSAEVKKGYKDFTFRMWVSEDVKVVNEEYLMRTFNARINVHANGNI